MWALAGAALRAKLVSPASPLHSSQQASQPFTKTSSSPSALIGPAAPNLPSPCFNLAWNPVRNPFPTSRRSTDSSTPATDPAATIFERSLSDDNNMLSKEASVDFSECDPDEDNPETTNGGGEAYAEPHVELKKFDAYGASQFGSASRMWDEREERLAYARKRTKCPTHTE
eukprot:1781104-Pleurochrysis_carterae.AAC.3